MKFEEHEDYVRSQDRYIWICEYCDYRTEVEEGRCPECGGKLKRHDLEEEDVDS